MLQSEKDISMNKPFDLFVVDGKAYKAQALSQNAASDWMDKVEVLSELEAAYDLIKTDDKAKRSEKRKYHRAFCNELWEVMKAYTDTIPWEEIKDKVSSIQLAEGFRKLVEVNDPIAFLQSAAMEENLARISKLPQSAVNRVLEKQLGL